MRGFYRYHPGLGEKMKGIIMIIDGMADRPLEELKYKTPLEAAETPNMVRMAQKGHMWDHGPHKTRYKSGERYF